MLEQQLLEPALGDSTRCEYILCTNGVWCIPTVWRACVAKEGSLPAAWCAVLFTALLNCSLVSTCRGVPIWASARPGKLQRQCGSAASSGFDILPLRSTLCNKAVVSGILHAMLTVFVLWSFGLAQLWACSRTRSPQLEFVCRTAPIMHLLHAPVQAGTSRCDICACSDPSHSCHLWMLYCQCTSLHVKARFLARASRIPLC